MKRQTKTAEEVDAYSEFGRRYLVAMQRAGFRSAIKRRTRRRERREAKDAIRREAE